jgi:hypothetical protein
VCWRCVLCSSRDAGMRRNEMLQGSQSFLAGPFSQVSHVAHRLQGMQVARHSQGGGGSVAVSFLILQVTGCFCQLARHASASCTFAICRVSCHVAVFAGPGRVQRCRTNHLAGLFAGLPCHLSRDCAGLAAGAVLGALTTLLSWPS